MVRRDWHSAKLVDNSIKTQSALSKAGDDFEDAVKNSSGTVRVGCFTSIAAFIIAIILKALAEKGLDISLNT